MHRLRRKSENFVGKHSDDDCMRKLAVGTAIGVYNLCDSLGLLKNDLRYSYNLSELQFTY